MKGEISPANALTGTRPRDAVGSGGITALPGGGFLVGSPDWNGKLGAWTWGSPAAGARGEVSAANSHVGTPSFPLAGLFILQAHGDYALSGVSAAALPGETGRRGLFVAGDGASGGAGVPGLYDSINGGPRTPGLRPSVTWDPVRGRWLVGYAPDNAVTVFVPMRGIAVTGPEGRDVRDESIPAPERGTDFGGVPVNGVRTTAFTVADAGIRRLALTGDAPVQVTGANAAEFTVTRQPSLTSADAAGPDFGITFKPAGPGPREAVISIASNAEGEGRSPYTFSVRGTGLGDAGSGYEAWRAGWAGQAAGGTAPAEDFDGDGVSNLLEFAFGTDPAVKTSGPAPLEHTGPPAGGDGILVSAGGPVIRVDEGGTGTAAHALWTRRRDHAAAGLKYTPQFSADLQTWRDSAAEPVVLAGDETAEVVSVPFPAAGGGADGGEKGAYRFFRLEVTLEP